MRGRTLVRALLVVVLPALFWTSDVTAQPLGTHRWQLHPFCNVLTLNVTHAAGVFTLDGFDDVCGGPTRGSVTGMAVPNPDGSMGLGLTLVLTPGATPLHIRATLNLSTISGTWVDSGGNSGAFVFNPSIAPGSPRPAIKPVFSAGLSAGNTIITNVANPVSSSDAATKSYVDSSVAAASHWIQVNAEGSVRVASPGLADTVIFRPPGNPVGTYCLRFPSGTPVSTFGAVGSLMQPSIPPTLGLIIVTTSINICGNSAPWNVAVQTFTLAGSLADRYFTILVPR